MGLNAMNQLSKLLLAGVAFVCLGTILSSLTQPQPDNGVGLEALKGYVGTWVVTGEGGHPTEEVVSVVRATAGGSVLMETLFPGSDHEMITMYYVKDERLMLTHYCGCTNHPIMAASKDDEGNLRFDCIGRGENFDVCADTPHMHDAVIRRDGDKIHSTWRMFVDGEVDHVADFHLVKVEDAVEPPEPMMPQEMEATQDAR